MFLFSLPDGKQGGAWKGQWLSVNRLSFSADDRTLVGVGYGPGRSGALTIKFWDVERLSERKTVRITALVLGDLSADGAHLATLPREMDNVFDVWNTDTGELEKSTFQEGSQISHVVFSPDGKWVAVRDSARSEMKVFEWRIGRERIKFEVPKGNGGSPAFSPDGERIVWLAMEKVLLPNKREREQFFAVVSSTKTGKQLLKLPGVAPYACTALRFAPSGRCVMMAGSATNGVRFYDAEQETSKLLCLVPTGEERYLRKLVLSDDGKRLAAGMADGSVVLFDVPPEAVPLKPPEKK